MTYLLNGNNTFPEVGESWRDGYSLAICCSLVYNDIVYNTPLYVECALAWYDWQQSQLELVQAFPSLVKELITI